MDWLQNNIYKYVKYKFKIKNIKYLIKITMKIIKTNIANIKIKQTTKENNYIETHQYI